MPITVIAYVLVYFGGIYMAFVRHPIWGFGSYLVALYISPDYNWFGSYLPNLRWSLLASLCILISIYLHSDKLSVKRNWLSTGPARILLLYAAWMWIQTGWAVKSDMHMAGCVLATKYLILYTMIYKTLNTDKDFFYFIAFNIIGAAYIARSVLAYSAGGRVEGIGGPGINDSNTLGMHLCVILILCSILILKKNTIFLNFLYWRISKLFFFFVTPFIANAVVQTISRSAILGIVSAGFFLILVKHVTVKKKFYIYLAIASCGMVYFTPYTFWERLDTVREAAQGGEIEGSAYSRIVIGKAQLEMFKDNMLGHGHKGTFYLSPDYLPPEYLTYSSWGGAGRSSHCTFLTALTEQGIPGAFLFICMVLWVAHTILVFRKDDPVMYLYFMGVSASLVAIGVAGLFVDYLKAEIQIICLAMLASLKDYQVRDQYRKKAENQVQG